MRRQHCTYLLAFLLGTLTATVATAQTSNSASQVEQVLITADKMSCEECAQQVTSNLKSLRGVQNVSVNLPGQTVVVAVQTPSAATLGRIWHAVDQGTGGPSSLQTSTAIYDLLLPRTRQEVRETLQLGTTQYITLERLHCKGCAEKVAKQLRAIPGVTSVSSDLHTKTVTVKTQSDMPISPWVVIDAVAQAKERPVMIRGNFGTLAITWSVAAIPVQHH